MSENNVEIIEKRTDNFYEIISQTLMSVNDQNPHVKHVGIHKLVGKVHIVCILMKSQGKSFVAFSTVDEDKMTELDPNAVIVVEVNDDGSAQTTPEEIKELNAKIEKFFDSKIVAENFSKDDFVRICNEKALEAVTGVSATDAVDDEDDEDDED